MSDVYTWSLDKDSVAGLIAILFLIGFLIIFWTLAWRFFLIGDMNAIEAIKTIWSILGPIFGWIMGYYFKDGLER